jgi:hypothetical protein
MYFSSRSCPTTTTCNLLILQQWCLQSHLSTENPENALNGLQRTRTFRYYTNWVRWPGAQFVIFINSLRNIVFQSKLRQRTLVWTRNVTYKPPTLRRSDIHDDEYGGTRGYDLYSPPPPTFSSGRRWGSEDVPLIVVPPGSGSGAPGSVIETYDPFLPRERSGSVYSGYTGYHSVSGTESGMEMEVLDGVAPETLLTRRPVFPTENSEGFRGEDDQGGGNGMGKAKE